MCFSQHHKQIIFRYNNKVKHFCGGVTGTESLSNQKTGIRYSNYSHVCETLSELSGPFLWYDFERTHQEGNFDTTYDTFGLSSSNIQYGNHYDYSGSGDLSTGYLNISGRVEPVTKLLRVDGGSYASFTITPGSDLSAYFVQLSGTTGAKPYEIASFQSPDATSPPIGGSTGFNSKQGPGILQNSYSQFARSFSTSVKLDAQFSASCFYNRSNMSFV